MYKINVFICIIKNNNEANNYFFLITGLLTRTSPRQRQIITAFFLQLHTSHNERDAYFKIRNEHIKFWRGKKRGVEGESIIYT